MTLTFLLGLIRPYQRGLLVLMGILVAQSAISLFIPWVGGQLGAAFLEGGEGALAPPALAGIIIGLLAGIAVLRVGAALLYARVSESILADLRKRLFDHLLALPIPWHQARNRGDVMAIITLETERLGHFVTGTLVSLLPLVLTAVGASILMLRIDPVLAILVPVMVPAFYILVRLLGRLLRGLAERIQSEYATSVSMLEEMLDLLPAIKSFTAEPFERRRFSRQIETLRSLSLRQARIHAVIDPVMGFAVSASAVVLLFMAGRSLQTGQLTAAETIAFLMYVSLLIQPVSRLALVYGQVQTARGTLQRLQDVLSEPPEPAAAGAPLPDTKGDIRFEGVTFAYPGRAAAVRDLTLHIRPGETVALTGPNGAGKTTAVGLLLGPVDIHREAMMAAARCQLAA
jgi:ATP-binding cassette, subfamily B, bacterial